jgi:hypothetical protein
MLYTFWAVCVEALRRDAIKYELCVFCLQTPQISYELNADGNIGNIQGCCVCDRMINRLRTTQQLVQVSTNGMVYR